MTSPSTGYGLIEFERLHPLVSNRAHHGLATVVLGWAANELQSKFDPTRNSIEIDVIKVKYIRPYPALGVRYLTQESSEKEALADAIRIAGEELINQSIVGRFIDFAGQSLASWDDRYRELQIPGSQYYKNE